METGLTIAEAFEKWGDDLVAYATALVGPDDAGDAVHQAFLDVLASNRWEQIRERRGYLFRATLNAARAQRRSASRREAREWRARPDAVAHLELLADPSVLDAVKSLSLQQRSVIFLTYWEDLSPSSVAAVLNVSDGTVRRQLARARSKLRKVLT